MIVCICRNIKSSEYSSEEELKDRIMQDDFQCGLCQLQYLGQHGGTRRWTTLEQGSNPNSGTIEV